MEFLVLLGILVAANIGLSVWIRRKEKALGVAPSVELRKAIWVGLAWVNVPILPIMLAPLAFAQYVLKEESNYVLGLMLLLGSLLAWAWWSVNVSLWRRWAARRGLNPRKLQTQGETSNLLWPKGHFFERTEYDQLRKKLR